MRTYIGLMLLLFSQQIFAVEFRSGEIKTTVIELYTSEGCSSCPPADKWLSAFKHDPNLFKSIIPMAFHVDYWDHLGWKDPWSQAGFSQRQRDLADQGGMTAMSSPALVGLFSQVYTPAVLVAGNEWPAWRKSKVLPRFKAEKKGILSAKLEGQALSVNYSQKGDYELNIAFLGMGLESDITAGENKSRQLQHDFVVLKHIQKTGDSQWELLLPEIPKAGQQQTAVSIWLTKRGSLVIEQATAAFLQ